MEAKYIHAVLNRTLAVMLRETNREIVGDEVFAAAIKDSAKRLKEVPDLSAKLIKIDASSINSEDAEVIKEASDRLMNIPDDLVGNWKSYRKKKNFFQDQDKSGGDYNI